jgi:hypothetical protein
MCASRCRRISAWFDGRDDVTRFLQEQVFATPWRLQAITANDQPAFACYQWDGEHFTLGAINVLTLRFGQISWIAAFLDPEVFQSFGLPTILELS